MTSFHEALASRRMCRDFTSESLDPKVLDEIVRAAFRAPSAGNTASLEVLVLTGADVGRYWDTTLGDDRRRSFPWPGLLHAPALLVPYVDPGSYVARYSLEDKAHSGLGEGRSAWSVPYWFVDGGASVMAVLLAVEAVGLGALFFGQFEHEEAVARVFEVPDRHRALGTIAVGHCADGGRSGSSSTRRSAGRLQDRVHHGRW